MFHQEPQLGDVDGLLCQTNLPFGALFDVGQFASGTAEGRRVQKTTRVLALAAILPFLIGAGAVSAAADEPVDVADASATISEIAPNLSDATSESAPVLVDTAGDDDPTVAVDAQSAPGAEENQATGVSFTIDYAEGGATEDDGISVLKGSDEAVAAYVQPLGSGVRVLTAIADASAPEAYDYTFDVPEGTRLAEGSGLYYLEDDHTTYGSLQLPWALDANGKSVPTSYSWSGKTLTQHVDLSSPDISFPVLADPAWGYTWSYDQKWSGTKNWKLLHNCFNCYFPVAGAPRNFPSYGQDLPLTVGPANFHCKMAQTFSNPDTGYYGWQFNAASGHIDGAGSNIVFEFRNLAGPGNFKLYVSAYIVNDNFWLTHVGYRDGAHANWAAFSRNLNNAP
jgi:hypothetical protein